MTGLYAFINEDKVAEFMRKECKEAMINACEPVIQEAMKKIESTLRREVGSIVVGMIRQDINVLRNGQDLVITVLHRESKV